MQNFKDMAAKTLENAELSTRTLTPEGDAILEKVQQKRI